MIDIEKYIGDLIKQLKNKFDSRLLYVGLQGSYLRNEANSDSDIDIMIVIDKLSVSDLEAYRGIIKSMDYYDKSCGFICSKIYFAGIRLKFVSLSTQQKTITELLRILSLHFLIKIFKII